MVKPLHSVIDKVYRMANLAKASAKVCANKGAAGVEIIGEAVKRVPKEIKQKYAEDRKSVV